MGGNRDPSPSSSFVTSGDDVIYEQPRTVLAVRLNCDYVTKGNFDRISDLTVVPLCPLTPLTCILVMMMLLLFLLDQMVLMMTSRRCESIKVHT